MEFIEIILRALPDVLRSSVDIVLRATPDIGGFPALFLFGGVLILMARHYGYV